METPLPFHDVLDAVDRLTFEEQSDLAMILERRLAEQGRRQRAEDVREARREFQEGGSRSTTVDDLMDEISAGARY